MAESSSTPSSSQQPPLPSTQPPQPSQTPSQETVKSETPAAAPTAPPVPPVPGPTSDPAPSVEVKQEPDEAGDQKELDASVDQDIDMNATENNHNNNVTAGEGSSAAAANGGVGGGGGSQAQTEAAPGIPADVDPLAAAAAAPTSKKETSLREFLGKMDDYAPIIPDAVTAHYLTLAGLPPPGHGPNQTPPHLARLLALATQKFIADVAADSYQYARVRASNSSSASNPMGSLNAAAGLNVPGANAGAGASGAAAGVSGGEAPKGKASAHLGIQRPGFGGGGTGGSGQGRTVLTMEDLGMAVSEYGVNVKRGEFYR